jgi:outer membrane protein OmpA-like peptidoglycan-associated protein/tetratricopeptide (TPR) repeat protein
MKILIKYRSIPLLVPVSIFLLGCAAGTYRKADEKYNTTAYAEAIPLYQKVSEKKYKPGTYLKIADSYRKMNNLLKAEEYYRKASDTDPGSFTTDVWKDYAKVLASNEKYAEARVWLMKYKKEKPDDKSVENLLSSCDSSVCYREDDMVFRIKELKLPENIVTAFSAGNYNNKILFVAENNTDRHKYTWTGSSFLDIFQAELSADSSLVNVAPLNSKINTPYHEGPFTLSPDGKEIWFTRSHLVKNRRSKSKDFVNHLALYRSTLTDTTWGPAEPFIHNNRDYSTAHPSLSEDGKTLYFISDAEGGQGGTDIYYSVKTDSGWSKPQNMGAEINTSGNEMFPSVFNQDDKKFLTFASDGHPGIGGLDLYRADITDPGKQLKVSHFGRPLNSSRDDFAMVLNKDGHTGWISSNRDDTTGKDKIYSIRMDDPEFMTDGSVVNSFDKTPVSTATVYLIDMSTGQKIPATVTEEGIFSKKVQKDRQYKVVANATEFYPDSTIFSTVGMKNGQKIKVLITPTPYFYLTCKVVKKGTEDPLASTELEIMSSYGHKEEIVTDEKGTFRLKVDPRSNFKIVARKHNFFTDTRELTGKESFVGTTNVTVKLELEEIQLNKSIRLDNIYYDLNSAKIRKDAAEELDRLVKWLDENPEVTIELSSHTDSRGSDKANLLLSQKRAESAVKYIIGKGIRPDRIVAKGYGEKKILNKCLNNVKCGEDDHKYNRRTEVKIINLTASTENK